VSGLARSTRRASGAAALALVLAPAASAAGHLGHIVLSGERYLKLDASEADTRLVVSLTLGASEGRRVLESADADRDGELTQAEADAYLADWGRGLRDELPIEVDGERIEVSFAEPYLDPIGRVAPVPVSVEMVAHLPITAPEATIVVRDRMVRRESYDRTEVVFRGHDGAEVVRSGRGEASTARDLDLAFGPSMGVPMPDAVSMHVRYPDRSHDASPWIFGAVGVAGIALLSLVVRRARRTRS
jgi:hypothetical protein